METLGFLHFSFAIHWTELTRVTIFNSSGEFPIWNEGSDRVELLIVYRKDIYFRRFSHKAWYCFYTLKVLESADFSVGEKNEKWLFSCSPTVPALLYCWIWKPQWGQLCFCWRQQSDWTELNYLHPQKKYKIKTRTKWLQDAEGGRVLWCSGLVVTLCWVKLMRDCQPIRQ